MKKMRVLIVGENATNQYGGEAILPLHYFQLLNESGHEAFLVTHERVKDDLSRLNHLKQDQIFYIQDNFVFKWLNTLSQYLPARISWLTIGSLMYLMHSLYQWLLIRKVVRNHQVDVIHQPIPVSPKLPSGVFGFGVPVVIGPMNGGMHFPPAFEHMAASGELFLFKWLRSASTVINWLIPGKLFADVLLAANERTKHVLTKKEQAKTRVLPENGVFSVVEPKKINNDKCFHCLFVGRLVDWKAVDILLEAMIGLQSLNVHLTIVGTGPKEHMLKDFAEKHNLQHIHFAGYVPFEKVTSYYQQADLFLLPSLRECGGAVVLEAMSHGLPVIATKWGGPTDYVTQETGFLVEPNSRTQLVNGFQEHIRLLATNPEIRKQMGIAAIKRIKKEYMWQDKVSKMIDIYQELV